MILISVGHNEARLQGSLNYLMQGASPARIRIYDGSGSPARPAAITDAPTGMLLATIVLKGPPGEVVGNKLVLALPDDALVMANGTARWARVINGNGATVMDLDVSDAAGAGELKMTTTSLLAGGATRLLSGELG
ncbi:hypothetical protein G8A07_15535 [Roseateles sp. DAIF2]|uniref:hypothetical protein n=1 Tax=Roseateles sp. DAIF2 TaxID=2714952 RepID=UPI0018A2DA38|nr:hypothetical protein [Roseateles sp. DAIF2]QPF74187.1 hypothetical protein G8A07_15535 [Roseateles sp. DAIF2]